MIETNYQISCDACEDRDRQPMIVHSQEELGDTTLAGFWRHLRDAGWGRLGGKDYCPLCVRAHADERKEQIDANYKKRKKGGKLTAYERGEVGRG